MGAFPFKNGASDKDEDYRLLLISKKDFWKDFWNEKEKNRSTALSTEFKDFFERMASPNPVDRLSWEEVPNHKWFKKHASTRHFAYRKELQAIRILPTF